jgi:hypothetical protein
MRNQKLLSLVLFSILISTACSQESDSSSMLKDEFSMGGEIVVPSGGFAMGNDDDFNMGGTSGPSEPESCDLVAEGTDSLVGDYIELDLQNVTKDTIPSIPFAFVADQGYAIPAYSRAVQAVLADQINPDDPSSTRALILKPNSKNSIRIFPNQVFVFGTESQWLEFSRNTENKSIIVKKFKKGQAAPQSQAVLATNREFTSASLLENVPIILPEFQHKQLFVVERVSDDTLSFEWKSNSLGSTYECSFIAGPGPYDSLEYVAGYGNTEAAARANLQKTCEETQLVPGFESQPCYSAASATCQIRQAPEVLKNIPVSKPKLTAGCLKSQSGESARYLVGNHYSKQGQTDYPNVVAKAFTNSNYFFVARKKISDPKTLEDIAELVKTDMKSFSADGDYTEFAIEKDEVAYIGFYTGIGGVTQFIEFRYEGDTMVIKQNQYGGVFTSRVERTGFHQNTFQMYGISEVLIFNYSFGEGNPYDGSTFVINVAAQKLVF